MKATAHQPYSIAGNHPAYERGYKKIGVKMMKKIHFTTETDGFYGSYWKCGEDSEQALIVMLGNDSDNYMARTAVRWLHKLAINVMTMSAGKKDYGYHNYPLERIEKAIVWLKNHGNKKIGIVGASTTGTLALTAASYFDDITLTIGMTASDFVWQGIMRGFMQGKRDGCKELLVPGESLFSYEGKPLPFMPFVYQHPDYWHLIQSESKKNGNMIDSKKLFDDSEKAHPLTEDEMIKVENIKGILLLIGAEDDAAWDAAKYVRRIEKRLGERPHECTLETAVYVHGTHFIFPQSMMTMALPVGSGLFVSMCFSAAKRYPKECKEARIDIDRKIRSVIDEWKRM